MSEEDSDYSPRGWVQRRAAGLPVSQQVPRLGLSRACLSNSPTPCPPHGPAKAQRPSVRP